MPTQSLTPIVDVSVSIAAIPNQAPALNVGLIVGDSTVIPVSKRVATYSSVSDMQNAGWSSADPEYKAATLYFEQNPPPFSLVVGVQNTNATPDTTTLSSALVQGTSYTSLAVNALPSAANAGDPVLIGSASGQYQMVTLASAAASAATTLEVVAFTANAAYATGTNVEINPNETLLMAIQECLNTTTPFYGIYGCGAATSDVENIAAYIESYSPAHQFFYDTTDSGALNGTSGNVMATLQGDNYQRTAGIWSTTEYAGAAMMGLEMGSNTGLINSSFTMAYKSLVGVTPEVLTSDQAHNLRGYGGNIYTTYGQNYQLLVQGTEANGTPIDQVLNLDIIASQIQTAVMNLLADSPKVPLTDGGVAMITNAVEASIAADTPEGILAPGKWTGSQVLSLSPGQTLPDGYAVVAAPVASLATAQLAARVAPSIYANLLLAGAIEHVTIGVNVTL